MSREIMAVIIKDSGRAVHKSIGEGAEMLQKGVIIATDKLSNLAQNSPDMSQTFENLNTDNLLVYGGIAVGGYVAYKFFSNSLQLLTGVGIAVIATKVLKYW
jgi:hypothetical protein